MRSHFHLLVSLIFVAAYSMACQTAYSADSKDDIQWTEIHVDVEKGKSTANGSKSRPFATLTQAIQRANDADTPLKIIVAPGTYREGGLTINPRKSPLVIECVKGEAIISGADVWDKWKKQKKLYVADWPYDFKDADYTDFPKGDRKNLQPAGVRCEMVFVDDALLRQVMSKEELSPGAFFVDTAEKKLYIQLPKGKSIKRAAVEVSVRRNLMVARELNGFTLRNLAFMKSCAGRQHDGWNKYTILLAGEHAGGNTNTKPDRAFFRDLAIENCRFVWNNHSGITMGSVVGAEIRKCSFDNNGISGIGGNRLRNFTYEDCTFNENNWRLGKLGHVYSWAPAGTKHLFTADMVFRKCSFNRNYATGLWMDFGNENILVEECEMIENIDTGFYFEASYGPCTLRKCKVLRNGIPPEGTELVPHAGGVLMAESRGLTIEKCLIADNANYQVGIRSRERESSGYWSGKEFQGQCENLTITDSVIRGGIYEGEKVPSWFSTTHRYATLIARQLHAEDASYIRFLKTYKGEDNTFFNTANPKIFSNGEALGYKRVDLRGWQALTGQDKTSKWKDVDKMPR